MQKLSGPLQNLETRDTATLTPRFWLQGKRSAIDTARLDSTTHDGAENEERKEKMKKRENLQKSKKGGDGGNRWTRSDV